jgi:hypothetical protein
MILNVWGVAIISQANSGRQPSIRLIQNLYAIYTALVCIDMLNP